MLLVFVFSKDNTLDQLLHLVDIEVFLATLGEKIRRWVEEGARTFLCRLGRGVVRITLISDSGITAAFGSHTC